MDDTLTILRHTKFMQMVTACKTIDSANLPPSERASYYHALRVHLQVSQWKYLKLDVGLNVEEWGWQYKSSVLYPIKTDLEPAPANLLKYIKCNCKLSSNNTCGTMLCSCRRNGLKCVAACGDCRGEECENKYTPVEVDDDDDDFNRNIFDLFN